MRCVAAARSTSSAKATSCRASTAPSRPSRRARRPPADNAPTARNARQPAHAATPVRRRAHHPKRGMRRTDAPVDTACSRCKGAIMAIGPVQLIVLGFNQPEFHGEIINELERLRESDTVRVIDALAVHKDADGEIEVAHLSNLTKDEAIELGTKIGALIGLGIEGEEGMEVGAEAGAEAAAEDGVHAFSDDEAWDILEDIPNDSAAALILLEHHWAVPLRDAIARAGGFRLSDGFISPLDLVGIGLVSREDAEQLHAMETAATAAAYPPTVRRYDECSAAAESRVAPPVASPAAAN